MSIIGRMENSENFLKSVRNSLISGDKDAINKALEQIALRYGNIAKNYLETMIDVLKLSPDQLISVFNKMIEHIDMVQGKIEKRIKERKNGANSNDIQLTQEDKTKLINEYSRFASYRMHEHRKDEADKEIKKLDKEIFTLNNNKIKAKTKEERAKIEEELRVKREQKKKIEKDRNFHKKEIEKIRPLWQEFKAKNPKEAADIEKIWQEDEKDVKKNWKEFKEKNPETASKVQSFCMSQARKIFGSTQTQTQIPSNTGITK